MKFAPLFLIAALATPAVAQQANHQGMNHSTSATAANPYEPAMMKMNERMMAAMGPDAGETWTRKMIEHHRGAVDMSQIVLRNTQNADVRREAQKTITSQNCEIANLNAMLRKMGKRAQ